MEISTSLNLYTALYDSKSDFVTGDDYKEMIFRAGKCGFKCFDFDLGRYFLSNRFLSFENWRDYVKEIKEYADSLGVKFTQSHAFCFNPPEPDYMDEIMKKTIEAASIAGAPWIVMHPWVTEKTDKAEILEENIKRFRPYIEYAKSLNIGIAIENMPKRVFWFGEEVKHAAFYTTDELIKLVDILNDEYGNVGICWDTGHAFLSMENQYDDIVKLGSRLKVIHAADNDSQGDDHVAPFMGYINWKEIIKALREINYSGTFSFETHNHTRNLPDELIDDAVSLLYKIGEYIVNM